MSYAYAYPIHRRWVIAAAVSMLRWARREAPAARQSSRPERLSRAQLHRCARERSRLARELEQERSEAQLRALTVARSVI